MLRIYFSSSSKQIHILQSPRRIFSCAAKMKMFNPKTKKHVRQTCAHCMQHKTSCLGENSCEKWFVEDGKASLEV